MKQVNLFFLMALIGMISFTSCSTENSELQVNSTEDTKGRIDRYERDGVEINPTDENYLNVKKAVVKEVLKTTIERLSVRCLKGESLSNGVTYWLACVYDSNSGNTYYVELGYNSLTNVQVSEHIEQQNGNCSCDL